MDDIKFYLFNVEDVDNPEASESYLIKLSDFAYRIIDGVILDDWPETPLEIISVKIFNDEENAINIIVKFFSSTREIQFHYFYDNNEPEDLAIVQQLFNYCIILNDDSWKTISLSIIN